jgi:hypothetical protein
MKVEFLWFDECPNHEAARGLLLSVVQDLNVQTAVEDIDASDPGDAERLRFPGSPTIRVNGQDIEPDFEDPGDYSPRCRIYFTSAGMAGVPERAWIEQALIAAKHE